MHRKDRAAGIFRKIKITVKFNVQGPKLNAQVSKFILGTKFKV